MPSLPQERRRTEHRNPASRKLDRLSTRAILKLMNREDRKVAASVGREIPSITRAVDAIVAGIRNGGRLLYVGAGTSGRLAVLDASECPPTFGVSPNVVTAVIAGGKKALTGAVEGAEDSVRNAVRDLRAKRISSDDVVVGIAASGSTP
jgi:N-acetylmuramic acid 6-phosphate etherase